MVQFNIHKKDFHDKQPNSHSLFLSANCNTIPNIGSYQYTWEKDHCVLYISIKDMSDDAIHNHFYDLVNKVLSENNNRNKNEDNIMIVCEALNNDNNLIKDQIDKYEKRKKILEKDLDSCKTEIKTLSAHLKKNCSTLNDNNYNCIAIQTIEKQSDNSKYTNLLMHLQNNLNIDINQINDKDTLALCCKDKKNSKVELCKQFSINTKTTWEVIFDNLKNI